MTYLYGHKSEEIRAMQKALIEHGFDCGPAGADSGFGDDTLKAVKDAQQAFGLDPVDGVVRLDLLRDLGLAPSPKPSLFDQIGAAASIIKTLKGLSTMTTDNGSSATVDVKSAWLSKLNWTMAAGVIFNIAMLVGHPVPPDIQTAVITVGNSAFLVLGYIIKTFFTKTITPSSAAKL